jgi:hypothetical protein
MATIGPSLPLSAHSVSRAAKQPHTKKRKNPVIPIIRMLINTRACSRGLQTRIPALHRTPGGIRPIHYLLTLLQASSSITPPKTGPALSARGEARNDRPRRESCGRGARDSWHMILDKRMRLGKAAGSGGSRQVHKFNGSGRERERERLRAVCKHWVVLPVSREKRHSRHLNYLINQTPFSTLKWV